MVVVYAETWNQKFKKATFEAVSYGSHCAEKLGVKCLAVVFGKIENTDDILAEYGADQVIQFENVEHFEPFSHAQLLSELIKELQSKLVIINGTTNGKSLLGVLSGLSGSASVSNVTSLPSNYEPLTVFRSSFSSKGIEENCSNSNCSILGLVPNALGVNSNPKNNVSIEIRNENSIPKTEIISTENESGEIPLPEAERVVSAGRGMKGPENWNIITDLAKVLNAGTACSKPVSDIGWRPHNEHVGQTGIQINPELYIAIGISGAIQHLAGVSRSKTIVVINNDPEAPFFKAADYGIVGDAFDVVPRLTEAIRTFQN